MIRRWIFAFLFLTFDLQLSTVNCFPATKVFLRSGGSPIRPPAGWFFNQANSTQGSGVVGSGTNSIAGPLTNHYFPIATTGYICRTSGNTLMLLWLSAPLSSGVTISGTITPNIWGVESASQCNCGFRYEVLRWDVSQGGIVSSLGISTDNGATEWGTSAAVRTAPALTPTSTAFNTGDRIVMVMYNDDGNGVTEASGRSWTLDYNAATGVDGDTYLSFTETVSFSADSNNARALPMVSLLRPLLAWWAEYYQGLFS